MGIGEDVCVCVYIYIYILCGWREGGRERERERERENIGVIILMLENRSNRGKNCPSAILSITNPTPNLTRYSVVRDRLLMRESPGWHRCGI